MEKIDIKKRMGLWVVETRKNKVLLASEPTKAEAVRRGAEVCRKWGTHSDPVSLVIRKADGRIQEERTYPRSRDPRRSRG